VIIALDSEDDNYPLGEITPVEGHDGFSVLSMAGLNVLSESRQETVEEGGQSLQRRVELVRQREIGDALRSANNLIGRRSLASAENKLNEAYSLFKRCSHMEAVRAKAGAIINLYIRLINILFREDTQAAQKILRKLKKNASQDSEDIIARSILEKLSEGDQRNGFTLPEVCVSMVLLVLVIVAAYGIESGSWQLVGMEALASTAFAGLASGLSSVAGGKDSGQSESTDDDKSASTADEDGKNTDSDQTQSKDSKESEKKSTQKPPTPEEVYKKTVEERKEAIEWAGPADIVVGVPFVDEVDTIAGVEKVILKGLSTYFPNKKAVVILCGEKEGTEALMVAGGVGLSGYPNIKKIAFLKNSDAIRGKGWSVRLIMDIAQKLGAHCAFLDADLRTRFGNKKIGLNPEWIRLLLEPIVRNEADVILAKYITPYYSGIISSMFIYPLFASVYGVRVPWPISKEYGISYSALRVFLKEPVSWHNSAGRRGNNARLVSQSLDKIPEFRILVARVGLRAHKKSVGKLEMKLRQVVQTVFEEMSDNTCWHEHKNRYIRSLAVFGEEKQVFPNRLSLNYERLIKRYKRGFNRFHRLYEKVLPPEVFSQLKILREQEPGGFKGIVDVWARIVYHFLLAYKFNTEFSPGDIVEAFIPLYWARVSCLVGEIENFRDLQLELKKHVKGGQLSRNLTYEVEPLVYRVVKQRVEEQAEEFIRQRDFLLKKWKEEERAREPYLHKIGGWEFIPGVRLAVDQDKTRKDNREAIYAQDIYEHLRTDVEGGMKEFLSKFGLSLDSPFGEICEVLAGQVRKLEDALDSSLLHGRLNNFNTVRKMTEAIFPYIRRRRILGLKRETCLTILKKFPPVNLISGFNCEDLSCLTEKLGGLYDYEDFLALANWTEGEDYRKSVFAWMRQNLTADNFEERESKPLVVKHNIASLRSVVEMKEQSGFPRLTGRVVISILPRNMGGEFPKLRYLLTFSKNIVEMERFSEVWDTYRRGGNFIGKVLNSTEGHYEGESALSAHMYFENGNQKEVWKRLKTMAADLGRKRRDLIVFLKKLYRDVSIDKIASGLRESSRLLANLLEGYFSFITLKDGSFVSGSLWSWVSHGYKGRRGMPTPLSVSVERDWASAHFLLKYAEKTGLAEDKTINEEVIELMGEGRESKDLAIHLKLACSDIREHLDTENRTVAQEPPAGKLSRLNKGEPMLEPVKEHWWESKYILNAGVFKLNGLTYIIYRAVGDDGVTSRFGLAWTEDGTTIAGRLPYPVFWPMRECEGISYEGKNNRGVEDARIQTFGELITMLYIAVDGEDHQIALASLSKDDFLKASKKSSKSVAYRPDEASLPDEWKDIWSGVWRRHGLVYPSFPNKDPVFLPEKINRKFVLYHRVNPVIAISSNSKLDCPWPRDFRIVVPPRAGMGWFGRRLGGGANPLKTKFGWLHIIHGSDWQNAYRLGVMLTDLKDPAKVLYFSPNPILEPETEHEKGEDKNKYWISNVVFTCGAVPANKEMDEELDDDDRFRVYYGAADTVLCAAEGRVGDAIPEDVRRRILVSRMNTPTDCCEDGKHCPKRKPRSKRQARLDKARELSQQYNGLGNVPEEVLDKNELSLQGIGRDLINFFGGINSIDKEVLERWNWTLATVICSFAFRYRIIGVEGKLVWKMVPEKYRVKYMPGEKLTQREIKADIRRRENKGRTVTIFYLTGKPAFTMGCDEFVEAAKIRRGIMPRKVGGKIEWFHEPWSGGRPVANKSLSRKKTKKAYSEGEPQKRRKIRPERSLAAILRRMYEDGISEIEPVRIRDIKVKRRDFGAEETIIAKVTTLKKTGLIEGKTRKPFYLPAWIFDVGLESILEKNPELGFSRLNRRDISRVKRRVTVLKHRYESAARDDRHPRRKLWVSPIEKMRYDRIEAPSPYALCRGEEQRRRLIDTQIISKHHEISSAKELLDYIEGECPWILKGIKPGERLAYLTYILVKEPVKQQEDEIDYSQFMSIKRIAFGGSLKKTGIHVRKTLEDLPDMLYVLANSNLRFASTGVKVSVPQNGLSRVRVFDSGNAETSDLGFWLKQDAYCGLWQIVKQKLNGKRLAIYQSPYYPLTLILKIADRGDIIIRDIQSFYSSLTEEDSGVPMARPDCNYARNVNEEEEVLLSLEVLGEKARLFARIYNIIQLSARYNGLGNIPVEVLSEYDLTLEGIGEDVIDYMGGIQSIEEGVLEEKREDLAYVIKRFCRQIGIKGVNSALAEKLVPADCIGNFLPGEVVFKPEAKACIGGIGVWKKTTVYYPNSLVATRLGTVQLRKAYKKNLILPRRVEGRILWYVAHYDDTGLKPYDVKLDSSSASALNMGQAKYILLSITPRKSSGPENQMQDVLFSIDKMLGDNGADSSAVVKQNIFLKDRSDEAKCQEFLDKYYTRGPPATSFIYQPPANGALLSMEAIAVAGPGVDIKRINQHLTIVEHDGLKWAWVAGVNPDKDFKETFPQALNTLQKMDYILNDNGFVSEQMLRTWIYESNIVGKDSDGGNRYGKFNEARRRFFRAIGHGAPAQFGGRLIKDDAIGKSLPPASTGIGLSAGTFLMECLALDTGRNDVEVIHLQNPRQINAFEYPQKRLEQGFKAKKKAPPLFSRGLVVASGDSKYVFVSGTAAIKGSKTVHKGNVRAQTKVTLENVRLVLRQAKVDTEDVKQLRVYVKRKKDYRKVKRLVEKQYPGIPCVYVIADVCYKDLLVEIEAIALRRKVNIFVDREVKPREGRTSLLHGGVKSLKAYAEKEAIDAKFYVQSRAGALSGSSDSSYRRAGASVIGTRERLEEIADKAAERGECVISLKVKEPLDITVSGLRINEFDYLRPDRVLCTYLHLAFDKDMTEKIIASGVDAVALEGIKGEASKCPIFDKEFTDSRGIVVPEPVRAMKLRRGETLVCLDPMSIVAGIESVFQVLIYLDEDREKIIRGKVRGSWPRRNRILDHYPYPFKRLNLNGYRILITGGGTAGLAAAWAALNMGAEVTITDLKDNLDDLSEVLKDYGGRVEIVESPDVDTKRGRKRMVKLLAKSDAAIGAALVPTGTAPVTINKEVIIEVSDNFPRRRVFVDIAIDQGGNFEFVLPNKKVIVAPKDKMTYHHNPVRVGYGKSIFYLVAILSCCRYAGKARGDFPRIIADASGGKTPLC